METTLTMLEIFTIIAFAAGFLSAFTAGSGIIMLPALLVAGVPPHYALGTNRLFTSASLFTGAIYYIKQGLFNPRFWLAAIIAASVGTITGVVLTQLIPSSHLETILPIIIAGVAFYQILLKRFKQHLNFIKNKLPPHHPVSLGISVLLGIYSGFLGVGSGAIWTTIATVIFKINIKQANALAQFMCFISNSMALVIFIALSRVNFILGIDLALCGAAGAFFGAKVAAKSGNNFIQIIIIASTMSMATYLVLKNIYS